MSETEWQIMEIYHQLTPEKRKIMLLSAALSSCASDVGGTRAAEKEAVGWREKGAQICALDTVSRPEDRG